MSLRFTETAKWSDPWFRRLPCRLKLLWIYLCDNCDIAGVIELDPDKVAFEIGEPIDTAAVPMEFEGRVRALPKPLHWFMPKFVAFQFKGKFDPVRDHYALGVVKKLRANMLTIEDLQFVGGLLAPQGKDKGLGQGQDSQPTPQPSGKRDRLIATLRGLGMASGETAVEGWAQLCRRRAKCTSVDDALAFIDWAVRRGLKDGVNVQWANQAAIYADEWAVRPKEEA